MCLCMYGPFYCEGKFGLISSLHIAFWKLKRRYLTQIESLTENIVTISALGT